MKSCLSILCQGVPVRFAGRIHRKYHWSRISILWVIVFSLICANFISWMSQYHNNHLSNAIDLRWIIIHTRLRSSSNPFSNDEDGDIEGCEIYCLFALTQVWFKKIFNHHLQVEEDFNHQIFHEWRKIFCHHILIVPIETPTAEVSFLLLFAHKNTIGTNEPEIARVHSPPPSEHFQPLWICVP